MLGLLAAGPASADRPQAPRTVVTCQALANLRILMNETGGDPAAIRSRLGDPNADHLGCARTPLDRIEGTADRVVIGGAPYDCLKLKDSLVCRWSVSRTPAEK
ncbi:MAG: hypothetical protein PGN34_08275 [Methylobacterium frigidaeris]